MGSAQKFINNQISEGKDIVFGEEHTAIASTFGYMEQAVQANAEGIAAISLELPVDVQPIIDQVGSGTISRNDFIREMRMAHENSYASTAHSLQKEGFITDQDYSNYKSFIEGRVADIQKGGGENYTTEEISVDTNAFGALYDLSQTAAEEGVPIFATDLDREYVVFNDLGLATNNDWLVRLDDTTDFELLNQQVDIEDSGVLLIHRGVAHTWDLEGYNTGIEDYLERANRSVTVVGNYSSLEDMRTAFNKEGLNGNTIQDPTDHTIIGGEIYQGFPDQVIATNPNLNALTP